MPRPALGPHNLTFCIFRLLLSLTREADLLLLSRTEVRIMKTLSLPLYKPLRRGKGTFTRNVLISSLIFCIDKNTRLAVHLGRYN
jgi:hypothetical protein